LPISFHFQEYSISEENELKFNLGSIEFVISNAPAVPTHVGTSLARVYIAKGVVKDIKEGNSIKIVIIDQVNEIGISAR